MSVQEKVLVEVTKTLETHGFKVHSSNLGGGAWSLFMVTAHIKVGDRNKSYEIRLRVHPNTDQVFVIFPPESALLMAVGNGYHKLKLGKLDKYLPRLRTVIGKVFEAESSGLELNAKYEG